MSGPYFYRLGNQIVLDLATPTGVDRIDDAVSGLMRAAKAGLVAVATRHMGVLVRDFAENGERVDLIFLAIAADTNAASVVDRALTLARAPFKWRPRR